MSPDEEPHPDLAMAELQAHVAFSLREGVDAAMDAWAERFLYGDPIPDGGGPKGILGTLRDNGDLEGL